MRNSVHCFNTYTAILQRRTSISLNVFFLILKIRSDEGLTIKRQLLISLQSQFTLSTHGDKSNFFRLLLSVIGRCFFFCLFFLENRRKEERLFAGRKKGTPDCRLKKNAWSQVTVVATSTHWEHANHTHWVVLWKTVFVIRRLICFSGCEDNTYSRSAEDRQL